MEPQPHSLPLIALLLYQWRITRKLTQEQLAELADVSVRAISNIERGINVAPQRATVRSLANALGLQGNDRLVFMGAVRRLRQGAPLLTPHEQHPLHYTPLPIPLTPLIGREHLEAAAVHLLGRSTVRCLTLTGPIGVGKTRLALQVASTLASHFADGVLFIACADHPTTAIYASILYQLGITDCAITQAMALVVATLRDRHMLFVCDGFADDMTTTADIAGLLTTMPNIKVIVTSRTPLFIAGEQELTVTPLDLPQADTPSLANVEQFSAIALFLYYLRASRPDFSASPAEVATIVALCQQLDGLPLALELAAARTRVLALHELLPYLDAPTGLDFLATAKGKISLRNSIQQSYRMLRPTEQQVLCRLSFLSGSFTLADACAQQPDLAREQIVAAIETLRTHSLIIAAPAQRHDVPTFMLLRIIRWFGMTTAIS